MIVNINFHGIGDPRRKLEPGEDAYWLDRDRFYLLLDEIATWPSVRITFDDSNASDVETGLPALVARGLTADFFVVAGRMGQTGSVDEDGVRELRRQGMTIGTHGMHHRSWRHMNAVTRDEELVTARQRLSEVAEAPIELASCPLGSYDRRVLADLRRLGYARCFTSDRRVAHPTAWLQPRFSVRRNDTPASLREDALSRPGPGRRLRLGAAGLIKRIR